MSVDIKALKVDQLISVYRELRDRRDAAKKEFAESQKPMLALMDTIEGELGIRMQESGAESFKCATGTAYKVTTSSVKVEDWGTFLSFVQAREAWDMLERRAAKSSVEEFAEEHGVLPPGLSMNRAVEVQIRAPKGG